MCTADCVVNGRTSNFVDNSPVQPYRAVHQQVQRNHGERVAGISERPTDGRSRSTTANPEGRYTVSRRSSQPSLRRKKAFEATNQAELRISMAQFNLIERVRDDGYWVSAFIEKAKKAVLHKASSDSFRSMLISLSQRRAGDEVEVSGVEGDCESAITVLHSPHVAIKLHGKFDFERNDPGIRTTIWDDD